MGLDNPLHIAFLLVILLLVFGAKRLPEMGRSLGEGLRGFKDSISNEGGESHHHAAEPVAAVHVPVTADHAPVTAVHVPVTEDARVLAAAKTLSAQPSTVPANEDVKVLAAAKALAGQRSPASAVEREPELLHR